MDDIRRRFEGVRFRDHYFDTFARRLITPAQVREAIFSDSAEIIENYPDDPRGHSCLVLGWLADGRPVHVVLGLSEPLCIITVYDPSQDTRGRWEPDFRRRRATEVRDD